MSSEKPVVLVTGAGRGLGKGVALCLAERGYSVVINYVSRSAAAEETARECREIGRRPGQQFITLQADIGIRPERERMIEAVVSKMGRLDALVNNAGIAPKQRADITRATEASFEEIIRVNLQGPYFLTQAVVNYWLQQRPVPLIPNGFTVIFVTSISAEVVSTQRGEYCVAKAGLSMAGRLWAARLAGEGIKVYELRPGIMLTDMTRTVKDVYDQRIAAGEVPQKRWGTPQDVGLAAAALLDGGFPFSTGAVIPVDGGLTLQRL